MMAALGLFVFMLKTTPYQSMQHQQSWRHAFNSRIGIRPAWQFLGPGNDTMTLSGSLYPEITGGRLSLTVLQVMADSGKAWSFIDGSGTVYGMFVIESIDQTKTEFMSNGSARKIDFTLTLRRVDSSLGEMFGDLQEQFSMLTDNLSDRVREVLS
ncbi:phage tail protein [Photorhabdus laumondii subsp. laumondii]|uniref:Photorhabdus luminescens subsp. laumondii TTO1 complete genome segment 1/17 n=3 Tax=Photorhabdus laumondii TaxID=2218628 RepID=Q7NAC4_PHOLL|nr:MULTISPECIES: phage tail protein [Photorhabdus]AWK40035.1 phage tail protein [Photorhabdus laumondii subsp. laumondii]AXG40858.1 phage tail protein [Photorhabdus laumondii subsp. laumondii]AXG45379.1 phage tail protein [Photorhabdus laumondii subsp. laumondii]MCC8383551.1 phage tail protein [Photorhabdus laumondii]MCC8389581.1 phage tail protein [Photorhabdus laumondii]